MLLGEIVKVALEALRANKLRSLLTMLGIIIGVGAVITMIALGSGAQKSVQDRIQALGPTLLSIYPGQSFMRGVASGNRVSLTLDDDTALANNAQYVSAVVPELSGNLQVQKGDQNINVSIVGTTPNYLPVRNYTITAGRMFTAGDDAAPRRVVPRGEHATGRDRVVANRQVVRRRADDAHVDVLVALLDLQVAAQLRHDRAHVLGVVGERRVVVQREAHAVAAGDAAHEALARIDAQ